MVSPYSRSSGACAEAPIPAYRTYAQRAYIVATVLNLSNDSAIKLLSSSEEESQRLRSLYQDATTVLQ
jgi:hypothetical protein